MGGKASRLGSGRAAAEETAGGGSAEPPRFHSETGRRSPPPWHGGRDRSRLPSHPRERADALVHDLGREEYLRPKEALVTDVEGDILPAPRVGHGVLPVVLLWVVLVPGKLLRHVLAHVAVRLLHLPRRLHAELRGDRLAPFPEQALDEARDARAGEGEAPDAGPRDEAVHHGHDVRHAVARVDDRPREGTARQPLAARRRGIG